MKHRYTLVAIATGLVLSVAGCSGGSDKEAPKAGSSSSSPAGQKSDDKESQAPASDKVLAESKDGDIAVTITSATRDPGGYVTVSGTVRNEGNRSWLGENWRSDEQELRGNGGSLAGASLVDEEGKKKYLILRDTSGRCLCTKFSGQVRSGQSASWFAQFPAPPEGTTKLSFQVGSMPPAPLEITEGE
ncbi:hypothetical protein ACFVTY_29180 [Streptomyces sp. NPDC058067]|uniref:hypothetical protein n=1 Tax=Streptomyces sp. NPDC058067 TaxID=3346324 RepID=UPI0036E5EE67